MKKIVAFILALVLCLGLVACGNGSGNTETQKPGEGNIDNDTTTQTEAEALIIQDPRGDNLIINIMRFREIMQTVELTAENWMDYIEVCVYNKETTRRDAFGEITSVEKETLYELGAKGSKYYNLRDFAIEFKHKTTGELVTCKGNNDAYIATVNEQFSLDDYECTRVKGTLYLLEIPEEVIIAIPDSTQRMCSVGYDDPGKGSWYNFYLNGRRIGGMFDFLVYN